MGVLGTMAANFIANLDSFKSGSGLTLEQQTNTLKTTPDDQTDTSDASDIDQSKTPDTEEHNFFAEHGIPDAEERFRVYKIFREMYGDDKLRFPSFYEGYQTGYNDGPNLNELLELAIKAICYIAEKMTQADQEALAGKIFRLVPEIIFKNQEQDKI